MLKHKLIPIGKNKSDRRDEWKIQYRSKSIID